MSANQVISLEDRVAADVFQKSYRHFIELKPTRYRWNHLAPQGVKFIEESREKKWSVEKLSDYLNCPPDEAQACLQRYTMSKKINSHNTTAGRLRQAVFEWIGEVADLDESVKKKLADDLAKLVGNQLFVAAQGKENLLELAIELEGKEIVTPNTKVETTAPPPPWGPQWKE